MSITTTIIDEQISTKSAQIAPVTDSPIICSADSKEQVSRMS